MNLPNCSIRLTGKVEEKVKLDPPLLSLYTIAEFGGDFYLYYVGAAELNKEKDKGEKGMKGIRIVRTREAFVLPEQLSSKMTYLTTTLSRNGFVYHWYIELDAPTLLIEKEKKEK